MRDALLVGAGGFCGAVARFWIGGWVHRALPLVSFPIGTLVVNVSGCLVIGALQGLAESRELFGPASRLFLFIGVLGGYTTFSSFAYETLALARDGALLRAAGNTAAQVLLGLLAAWIGWTLARAA